MQSKISIIKRDGVLHDYKVNGMNKVQLSLKYKISRVTVLRIIRENHPSQEPRKPRFNLSTDLRQEINRVSLRVVALSLQAMEDLLINDFDKLTPNQLALFMSCSAPYTIPKAEKVEEAKGTNIYQLFKENLDGKINSAYGNSPSSTTN